MRRDLEQDLLKGVSRTFYLTLRLLPAPMRPAAGLGYLLARSTDTLADSVNVSADVRLHCLDQFQLAMDGKAPAPRWPIAVLNGTADLREKQLLERSDEIFRWLEKIPAAEAALVREVVTIIGSGQRLDVRRFAGASREHPIALHDDVALEDYAWRVAGSVGAFWTKLGFLTLGDRFSNAEPESLELQGIAYGKGLQLVNILRDVGPDLRAGRCYLPVKNPRDHDELLDCHRRWADLTLPWIGDGEAYAATLLSRRLRAATILPALLARKTLRPLRDASWKKISKPHKIKRYAVYQSLASAFFR